jgi:hypothetical protein
MQKNSIDLQVYTPQDDVKDFESILLNLYSSNYSSAEYFEFMWGRGQDKLLIVLGHDLVIIQEPFAKLNTLPNEFAHHSLESIAPSADLYLNQKKLLNVECKNFKKYGVHIYKKKRLCSLQQWKIFL